ncbi:hypothetical protein AB0H44_17745 [Streptomyces pseudogriseolus]|uniref:hypothetical protein n=1 Tax=Streptomyces pseudogriseolus TaxID=36817 RepID=UPI00348D04FE
MDTLLQMDTEDGSFLLAVESQGRPAPDKPASWAYYLSYVYAKYGIPPVLLVVCADRGTAEWAARQVDIGPRQWCSLSLRPLVLGPDDVPVIDSPDEAARDIPLTVLSAALRAESRAKDLLVLLGHRGVEVSEEDRERIVGCGDPDVLGLWFRKALTATSTAEIFASDGEAGADVG